jgi:sec-independent protein translocase protein TatB
MEILGIGPLEFLLIVLLALIILGPKEMQKVGKSLGRSLNKLVKSNIWKDIRQTSEKVRNLPTELMRDAELDDLQKVLNNPLRPEPKIAPPTAGAKPSTESPQVVPPVESKSSTEAPQIVPPAGTQPMAETPPTAPPAGEQIPPEENLHG